MKNLIILDWAKLDLWDFKRGRLDVIMDYTTVDIWNNTYNLKWRAPKRLGYLSNFNIEVTLKRFQYIKTIKDSILTNRVWVYDDFKTTAEVWGVEEFQATRAVPYWFFPLPLLQSWITSQMELHPNERDFGKQIPKEGRGANKELSIFKKALMLIPLNSLYPNLKPLKR